MGRRVRPAGGDEFSGIKRFQIINHKPESFSCEQESSLEGRTVRDEGIRWLTGVEIERRRDLFVVATFAFLPRSIDLLQLLLLDHARTMRVNGCRVPQLTQFRPIKVAGFSTFSAYRCSVHRTICRHATRPSLRIGASVSAPLELRRSAKTKSTLKLKDLPQGVLKLEPYNDAADDTPRYPAAVQGHRNNMQKFRNCVVLTRIGSFYEVRILA